MESFQKCRIHQEHLNKGKSFSNQRGIFMAQNVLTSWQYADIEQEESRQKPVPTEKTSHSTIQKRIKSSLERMLQLMHYFLSMIPKLDAHTTNKVMT